MKNVSFFIDESDWIIEKVASHNHSFHWIYQNSISQNMEISLGEKIFKDVSFFIDEFDCMIESLVYFIGSI